eukprot:m.464376 g.464376  ORF g.464376 m.464376 type:complete len:91 (-) comp23469_c0_seq1:1051-1323(-)
MVDAVFAITVTGDWNSAPLLGVTGVDGFTNRGSQDNDDRLSMTTGSSLLHKACGLSNHSSSTSLGAFCLQFCLIQLYNQGLQRLVFLAGL